MSLCPLFARLASTWLSNAAVKQEAYAAKRREWHSKPRYTPPPPPVIPTPRTAEMQAVVDATRDGEK
jgi:hypothetical protein